VFVYSYLSNYQFIGLYIYVRIYIYIYTYTDTYAHPYIFYLYIYLPISLFTYLCQVTDALAEFMGLRGNSTADGMDNRRDKRVQLLGEEVWGMDITCVTFWETLVRLTWTSPPLPKSNHVCQYLAIFGGISPKLSLNKVFVYSRFWTSESHVWCITSIKKELSEAETQYKFAS